MNRLSLARPTDALLVAALVLGGCGLFTKEGTYEGLKTRERIVNPPETTVPAEAPLTYPQYEHERRKKAAAADR